MPPEDITILVTAGFSTPEQWGFRSINAIVVHDLEGTTAGAINWWNTNKQSSAHYIVTKEGQIIKCVEPENIAWHAGTDFKTGRTDFWKSVNINGYSLGIELEGFTTDIWTDAQYDALVKIGKWAKEKYGIIPEHTFNTVAGWHLHSDISHQRSDPGPNFDMERVLSRIR